MLTSYGVMRRSRRLWALHVGRYSGTALVKRTDDTLTAFAKGHLVLWIVLQSTLDTTIFDPC